MMRQRMEGIRHADVRVGLIADFGGDHEALDARQIALVGQRHQVKHQVQMFIEVLRRRARHFRQMQLWRYRPASALRVRRSISCTLSR